MTKAKRWLVWGLIASPVALAPTAFVVSRLWLNHHLQREVAVGDLRLRLANPNLGWNLNFFSDSVEITAPRFSLRTGRIATDVRLWNSIASLKPNVLVATDRVLIRVEPDSLDSLARERKRRNRKTPSFPNFRIPVAFKLTAGDVELSIGAENAARATNLVVQSQGPKGLSVEASALAVRNPRDSALFDPGASYHLTARWFGKSVRYQARAQAGDDFLRLDGERRKSDLRIGKDSLEVQWAGFGAFAALFPHGRPPDFSALEVQASLETGDHRIVRLRTAVTTPRVWEIGPQRVEMIGNLEDSSGRVTLKSHGQTEESAYLQGHFQVPDLDSGFARAVSSATASLSGYTRDFRFRIADRILPGDAEIRRLKLLPGLNLEAEVRTRDSSLIHGRAFRAPDTSAQTALTSARTAPGARQGRPGAKIDSSWKCVFGGTIDPRESWVHAWVDTNVSFRRATVSAEAGRHGLTVEAWVKQPKAYGSAADSVYAVQTVNKTGYYLTGSRVSGKEGTWPVTGQVEWGKRVPGKPGRRQKVSLAFRTKHPRYGSVEYAMPRPRAMTVRAENLDCQHLPYVRLQALIALKPVVTGGFAWDWQARDGNVDAAATLAYNGQALGVNARAGWDARLFEAKGLDVSFAGSKLHFSGGLRLGGKQFWQMGKSGLKDLRNLSLEAERFDAASLSAFLGPGYPVEHGNLNGKLSYTDSAGFRGFYEVRDLELKPVKKLVAIPLVDLIGHGESLQLAMRTSSAAYPWLNDTLNLRVDRVLDPVPGLTLKATSSDGLGISFKGSFEDFRRVDGIFSVQGDAALPGQAGTIRDVRLGGHFRAPFGKDILTQMALDSGSFAGRYAIPGLDTQSFSGTMSLAGGRLRIPDLRAANASGPTLSGEADCDFAGVPRVTAKLRGENLALQWPGIQKLILRDADASLRADSSGLTASATVGKAEFASSRPPISVRGSLENLELHYSQPPSPKSAKGSIAAAATPQLKVKAKLRNFLFKHKIGFRELQKSIRTVKTDKRKKRVKPIDLQLNLETAGAENRIETDILRMVFVGDLSVKGVYPYTLLSGEFSSPKGELGQTSQSYDITDFDLKWQNATVEEGRISIEGGKRLKSDCKPETQRTCNVYVKLNGRLDEMAFTYDSDCGGNTGETLEPAALINSVSRGCFSDEYVAGAGGGGNYGEAVFVLLEPTINEKLTSVGDRFSGGWIKRTSVSGIGSAVSGDTAGAEPIAIGVESKEKWGMSVKAKAGYHPEKKVQSPWENKVALEWRPPLEKASDNSEWKRRVRDRVTLEASAETRPEERVNEENRQVRKEVGIRYRYKFWNLW